jgi:hypothetical protein
MKKVLIGGFGTLLLQESLGDTVGNQKRYIPMIIKGYQRLFNLLPDHYKADNRLRQDDTECGAANIQAAEGFQFNGLCFEADEQDLAALDQRERYYQRVEVPCFDFYTQQALGTCHVYSSPLDAPWLRHRVEELLPLWRDIVYARVGAYRISQAFGEFYDATTYLADGKTLLVDYYQDHLGALMDLEAIRPKA